MKNKKRYFKDYPWNHMFLVVEGTTVTMKDTEGSKIWRVREPKDLIEDFGHEDQKAYIKHLKKMGYTEVCEDMTSFVDWYNGTKN